GRLVLQAEAHGSDAPVKRVSDRDASGIHGLKALRAQNAHQVAASAVTQNHLGIEALGDTVAQPVVQEGAQLTGVSELTLGGLDVVRNPPHPSSHDLVLVGALRGGSAIGSLSRGVGRSLLRD